MKAVKSSEHVRTIVTNNKVCAYEDNVRAFQDMLVPLARRSTDVPTIAERNKVSDRALTENATVHQDVRVSPVSVLWTTQTQRTACSAILIVRVVGYV